MDNITTQETKKNRTPQILALLLILSVFVNVVFILIFFNLPKKESTPIPTPTVSPNFDGWNTFISENISYQLKYPPNNWDCNGLSQKCPYSDVANKVDYIRPGEPVDCGLTIRSLDNPEKLSTIDFWKAEQSKYSEIIGCTKTSCSIKNPSTGLESTINFSQDQIGNEIGTRISGQMEMSYDHTYITGKKDNIIAINFCRDETNKKILSTFSLIANKTVLPSPTTIQVYPTSTQIEGRFCGGFANIPCPDGYWCKGSEDNLPDAPGTCVKKTTLHNLLNLIFGRQD